MEYLIRPQQFLKKAKAFDSLLVPLFYILAASLLFTVASFIRPGYGGGMMNLSSFDTTAFAMIFVFLAAVGLFFSYIYHLIYSTLGGKGRFIHGLAVAGYSFLLASFGYLLGIVLLLIASSGGIFALIGTVLFILSVSSFSILALSSLYLGAKELYAADSVTALAGLAIMFLILFSMSVVGMSMLSMSMVY